MPRAVPHKGPSRHPVQTTHSDDEVRREKDSAAENVEQTGKDTFNVHHDDGSIFETVVSTTEAREFMRKAVGRSPRAKTMKINSGKVVGTDKDGWEKTKHGYRKRYKRFGR